MILDRFGNPYTKSEEKIQNYGGAGLGLYQFDPFGFPENQASPTAAPVENVNTLFHNLRWYLISNFRQVLNQAYVEIGLIQTIVDVPVDDAFRGGVEIRSKQLEEEQIEELQISIDRDDNLGTVAQGQKWNRLFGGAGILILTDQDPEEPLDIASIRSNTPLEFRAVDMWELFWDKQNTEGYDPAIQTQDFEYFNYYGEQVHKSRVMRLKGFICPSFIRPRLRGWGFSVVEVLVRSINQYLKATDLSFQVLDEFKIDIYKIKNLTSTLMSPIGQQKVQSRIQQANYLKNFQNALVMDSEDDWDHKQLSFAGLAEMMDGIRKQIAADMRMPMTKLFGISAAGFNSGEDDIEVYNAMVEAQVRNKAKYDVLRVCEIKCQKIFGYIPDDLSVSFKPLRVLGAEQEENVKTQKFNRLLQARTAGELSTYEFREACNKGNLFDISLDNAGEVLNPNDPEVREIVKEGLQNPYDPIDDINDPGADRADTRQLRAWEYGGIPRGPEKGPESDTEHKQDRVPRADTTSGSDKTSIRKPKKPGEDNRPVYNDENVPRGTFVDPKNVPRGTFENGSVAFDKASYEADGGDSQFDPRRLKLIETLTHDNPGLWEQCEDESRQIYGSNHLPFTYWLYKKKGGRI